MVYSIPNHSTTIKFWLYWPTNYWRIILHHIKLIDHNYAFETPLYTKAESTNSCIRYSQNPVMGNAVAKCLDMCSKTHLFCRKWPYGEQVRVTVLYIKLDDKLRHFPPFSFFDLPFSIIYTILCHPLTPVSYATTFFCPFSTLFSSQRLSYIQAFSVFWGRKRGPICCAYLSSLHFFLHQNSR